MFHVDGRESCLLVVLPSLLDVALLMERMVIAENRDNPIRTEKILVNTDF